MTNIDEKIGREEIITIVENTVYKMLEAFFDRKFKELQIYLDTKISDLSKDEALHKAGCKAYNMWDKEACEDYYKLKNEVKKHVDMHKQHEEVLREEKIISDKNNDRKLVNKRIIYSLIFTPILGLAVKSVYDFLYWVFHR